MKQDNVEFQIDDTHNSNFKGNCNLSYDICNLLDDVAKVNNGKLDMVIYFYL